MCLSLAGFPPALGRHTSSHHCASLFQADVTFYSSARLLTGVSVPIKSLLAPLPWQCRSLLASSPLLVSLRGSQDQGRPNKEISVLLLCKEFLAD